MKFKLLIYTHIGNIKCGKGICSRIVPLLQDGKQEMLCISIFAVGKTSLELRDFKYLVGNGVE